MRGTIKTVRPDKGFGFVTEEGSGDDYFFHASDVAGPTGTFDGLKRGEVVQFEADSTPKGLRARRIERA